MDSDKKRKVIGLSPFERIEWLISQDKAEEAMKSLDAFLNENEPSERTNRAYTNCMKKLPKESRLKWLEDDRCPNNAMTRCLYAEHLIDSNEIIKAVHLLLHSVNEVPEATDLLIKLAKEGNQTALDFVYKEALRGEKRCKRTLNTLARKGHMHAYAWALHRSRLDYIPHAKELLSAFEDKKVLPDSL